MPTTLAHLNTCSRDEFVALVGPVFEHSPWIATAAAERRPFATCHHLHATLCAEVNAAGPARWIELIRAHPDLVGRAVLTAESTREQAAAGLSDLTPDDRAWFDRYNTAYKARFGFPFVICARQNDKAAILRAFPDRLGHERDEEIRVALHQIFQIAALRLADLLPETRSEPQS
jgi:2-oxo-4-hydroxy-4-carboxy-5-ureidoimidazoline decarboxylase